MDPHFLDGKLKLGIYLHTVDEAREEFFSQYERVTRLNIYPYREYPAWWQFSARKNAILFDAFVGALGHQIPNLLHRRRFFRESLKGQQENEDAGGFMWRCWSSMLGYRPELEYHDASQRLYLDTRHLPKGAVLYVGEAHWTSTGYWPRPLGSDLD